MEITRPKILFLVPEDWAFWLNRLNLARATRDAGYEVLVATRVERYGDQIQKEGFKLIPLSLKRGSKNPLRELFAIVELIRIYRRERPNLVHHVAMKLVLYGSWAARFANVPSVVNAITGLGSLFIAQGWKMRLLRKCIFAAYKTAFIKKCMKVIFQNPDDLQTFISAGILDEPKTTLIKGSGVDITVFQPMPESNGLPLVVLASRMLWDKGIKEFVDAANILKLNGIEVRFALVGDTDSANPSGISRGQLERWAKSGVVEWWGWCEDMIEVLAKAHIVCLPSYREGVPKALIEAAACGRPIVTTDTPGCREIVRHGENGFLVPVRDSKALAVAIQKLIENPALRIKMGKRGRDIAVTEFSDEKVIRATLAVYRELLDRK